ncbi:MAG: polymerase, sigma-24 subunit, subfamily [Verrucomicrobiales bacterium]|nr:polymerase, sigma-24 subunit, subfamily [Verrucomicrobiales bacterium]
MTNLENQKLRANILDDPALVAKTLAGDRESFGLIVERYQNLVCSVTYSQTGNLSQSEDLAQETFLTAWKQLAGLREPEKLKSWLCGIARNLTRNWLRKTEHDPETGAVELLEDIPCAPSALSDHVIQKEEETILWQSLKEIPELYREPLVLFYREHQSVEAVATSLEISEEAVRQRLFRGRRLLQDRVLSLVEGTLQRSGPGKAFTLGVIAALPAFTTSATAASMATGAAKGTVIAKSAMGLGVFGALLGPVLGILGSYFGIKASINATNSPRERAFVIKMSWWVVCLALAFTAALGMIIANARKLVQTSPAMFAGLLVALILGYTGLLVGLIFFANRRQKWIREEESPLVPVPNHQGYEYRSPWQFLGFPLIHVKFGNALGQGRIPAKGWIAIGDSAIGGVLAVGGIAFGGIAVGGVSCGVISLGGLAFGVFALGGFAGGWIATGGAAVAWKVALGGAAIAHHFAKGGLAIARHANDAGALSYFSDHLFARLSDILVTYSAWTVLFAFFPLILKRRKSKRRE